MKTPQFELLARVVETHWWYTSRADMIGELVRRLDAHRVLEIGCGVGTVLCAIRGPCEVVGIDIDYHATTICKWKVRNANLPTVYVLRASAYDIGLRPGYFDVIILADVLEHTEDDLKVIMEAKRLLRLGGHMIVVVPALMIAWSRFDNEVGHRRRYTKQMLKELLSEAELSTSTTQYWNTLLLPIVLFFRRVLPLGFSRELSLSNRIIGRALRRLLVVETKIKAPLGLSLIAIACKTE